MKIYNTKYLLSMLSVWLLASTASMAAGRIAEIWSNPAIFFPNEEVTLYFDVSGTDLESASDVYLWTWSPDNPAQGNGDWDNSAEHMKLTKVSGNIYSFTMVPTTFYGKSAEEITQIFGLLKSKTGNQQTDNFEEVNGNAIKVWQTSEFDTEIVSYQPGFFSEDRPLSIVLNASLAYSDGGGSQGQLVGVDKVALHSGINGWQNVIESSADKAELKKISDNIYKLDFIPAAYYGTSEPIKEINFLFNNDGSWDKSGRDIGGENFMIKPTSGTKKSEISIFPSKFTVNDIVTVYFDQSVTESTRLAETDEIYITITASDDQIIEGKAVPSNVKSDSYEFTFIPAEWLSNDEITEFTVIFRTLDREEATREFKVDNQILITNYENK